MAVKASSSVVLIALTASLAFASATAFAKPLVTSASSRLRPVWAGNLCRNAGLDDCGQHSAVCTSIFCLITCTNDFHCRGIYTSTVEMRLSPGFVKNTAKGKRSKMQEMASKINDYASEPWQRAGWYRATPLTERHALKQKNTDGHSSRSLRNSDRAKQRLQRWKEQPPFDRGDNFARRLAMDSLTEDDLLTLLDEPSEATQAGIAPPPTWFVALLTAFTDQDTAADFTWSASAMGQETQT